MSRPAETEAVVTPCLLISAGCAAGVLFQQGDVTLLMTAEKADELSGLLKRAAVEARHGSELARTDRAALRAMLSGPVAHA